MNRYHRSNSYLWRDGILLVCALLCLLFPKDTSAGVAVPDSSFLQHVWQTDQGLPHDSVTALLQTRDGYLWVGTRRGLARFDGVHFTVPPELSVANESIYALCEDNEGNLWISTENGVIRFKDGKVVRYRGIDGLVSDHARTILAGKDGSIWIATTGGLSQFKDGTFHNFTQKEGLAHNVVRSICEDDEGAIWIATVNGPARLKDGTISIPQMDAEWSKAVRVIYHDRENNIWVGTQMGLCKKKEKGWDYFARNLFPLSDDFVNTIYSDKSGRLWLGTYGGLNWLSEGKFHTEFTSEGAAYDLVNAICEDREGNVWIGSKEGLTRLKPRPFTTVSKPQGLSYNNVMSVMQDNGGTFWCATWGGGVFSFQQKALDVVATTNYLPNYRILSLCQRQDGSLWFGTDHGAGLFALKNHAWTHYDESHGIEVIGIPVLYEDREKNLWLGNSTSLSVMENGRFRRYTTKDGLAGEAVKAIYEDTEGNLWIGTNRGLSRRRNGMFNNFTMTNGLSHNTVQAFYEDKNGDLWIGTGGGGLNRLRNGKFTAYTTRDGLFNDDVLEIIEDDHGYFWMSCLKGLFRVSKKSFDSFDRKEITSLPCTSYGKEDGMASIICCNVAKPAAWKGNDGRLWFATTKGIVIADPNMKVNDLAPPIAIEAIMADKTTITNGGASAFLIPPGRGELEIHFTALSFSAPEKNRFKYKLDGIDSDWVDVGTRRFAYYNNLAPGNYQFHLVGSNNDGVWNSLEVPVKITLRPHWWQKRSFGIFVVVATLSLVFLGARYLTKRRMGLKLKSLEQQHAIEKERSRIARDMHDDLGACLTQILFLSDVAKKNKSTPDVVENQVNSISRTTQEVIRNLDGIVWAVNPENDSLERFAGYVEEYICMFLQTAAIRCRLDFPEKLPAISLSSEVRHHLFLTVKEALNNVAKYSAASEVRVTLKFANGVLSVAVEDNGKGFALADASTFGNGLRNMEQRIKSMGGCFELDSQIGKGTSVRLQVRLAAPSAV